MDNKSKQLSIATIDLIPEPIFWMKKDGRVYLVNDASCKKLGYTRQEIIKLKASDMANEFDDRTWEKHWKEVSKNENYIFRINLRRKDKSEYPVEIHSSIVTIEGEEFICGIARDLSERTEYERKLESSESKYKTLFEGALDSILLMKDNVLVDCNDIALKVFGVSEKSEIIGKTPSDLSPDNQYDGVKSKDKEEYLISETLKGRPQRLRWKHYNKDKEIIETEISLVRLDIEDEVYMQVHLRDISDQILMENALINSESRYRTIVEEQSQSISRYTPDGTITYVNDSYCNYFGIPRNKLLGKNFIELLSPSQRQKTIQTIAKLTAETPFLKDEYKFTYDGNERWMQWTHSGIFDNQGNIQECQSEGVDITNLKETEKALRLSEQKFETIFRKGPTALTIISIETSRFLEANSAYERLSGYTREELIGKTTLELGLWAVPEQRNKIRKTFEEAGTLRYAEIDMRTKDGTIRNLVVSGDTLNLNNENILLSGYDDITEKKIKDIEIAEYQENLRMVASELTLAEERHRRRVAEDIHDYLGQSLALAKIKLGNLSSSEISSDTLVEVLDIEKDINSAITFSQSTIYELSPPVLHELGLEEAIKWKIDQITDEYRYDFTFYYNPEIPRLDNDIIVLLFRSFIELTNNIVKHAKASRIDIGLDWKKNKVRLNISDNGKGFDTSGLRKEAISSNKFGLFSIQERINYLGGSMKIESSINEGSSIKIKLPFN